MAITIDIGERIRTAFGFTAASQRNKLATQDVEVYVSDYAFEDMTLRSPDNQVMVFRDMIEGVDSGIYAPPPMINFTKSKNLVITEIDGTSAEVVEKYGDKSWEVKIKGILVDTVNHRYPSSQMIKLREFFDVAAPFAVEGQMFDDLGISSIYFTQVDISGVAGYEDTVQYSIDARSIRPVEFFLINKPAS
jgi:hypothetical protein